MVLQEVFSTIFEGTLLRPELGTIYGNSLGSNDGAKLGGIPFGTSESAKK